jgi:putative nucleotidyltransferase with HDIG domain
MKDKVHATLQNLPRFIKYLVVLGVVAFISLLFPNNAKFQYTFEKGQTWRYEDLYAPFDFAIKKSAEEITLERQSIEKDFSPFYRIDQGVAIAQQNAFDSAFDLFVLNSDPDEALNEVQQNKDQYIQFAKNFIRNQYRAGIIALDSLHQDSESLVIQVVDGDVRKSRVVTEFNDVQDVIRLLRTQLAMSPLENSDIILPILEQIVVPNISYDRVLSNRLLEEQFENTVTSKGIVKQADLIIPKDGIVTDEIYQSLLSFQEQYEEQVSRKKSYWGVFLGYLLLTCLLIGVFLLYLRHSANEIYTTFSKLFFALLWFVVFSYLVYITENNESLSAYLIPFSIVPILLKNFFNQRVAIFTHVIIILIASFLTSLGYEFTFLNILAGIVAVVALSETRDWSRFFRSILMIFLAYALGYLGLSLIVEGSFSLLDHRIFIYFIINAILTLLAYPLIPLFSRIFGFTSSISLAELGDVNRPLLKNLSIKAPGTFQHSLQVANLSEAAADKIGANTLFVRVAALYHDIGKMKEPSYFVENQSGENPHDALDNNFESARKIIEHVHEGVRLAQKARLPKSIIEVIKTHHGTTRVEYFYRNQLKSFPDKEFDETIFIYPGPKPSTKEETILMLADSLEASSKSLKNPTGSEIDKLVDSIIAGKIDQEQLEESALTFEELEASRKIFKQLLRSIHHVRIEYPEEVKSDPEKST